MKKENMFLVIFGLIFIFSVGMAFNSYPNIGDTLTGYATEGTSVSNVTITTYLSITMSGNLTNGILFGDVDTLPAANVNASSNNNSMGNTTFMLNVSSDSNTAVDFCLKANANLATSGGDFIAIANETYANSTTTNATTPLLSNEVSFTTSYVKSGEGVGQGNGTYYRFWLDIPSGTATGTYNNTITFKGVQATTSC